LLPSPRLSSVSPRSTPLCASTRAAVRWPSPAGGVCTVRSGTDGYMQPDLMHGCRPTGPAQAIGSSRARRVHRWAGPALG
jgi:hypothetical protein